MNRTDFACEASVRGRGWQGRTPEIMQGPDEKIASAARDRTLGPRP
jgi:hypothetical protein